MKNLWAAVQQGAASGVLAGGYPYAHNNWYIGMSAPVFGRRIVSLTDLFKPGAMEPGDIAFLGPQAFHEDNLVIPAALTNITLIGAGNRGACYIEPTGLAANGLKVLANDVTLLNIGLSKDSRADYALQVGDATLHPDRFRAYGCKIEGGGVAGNLYGAGDVLFTIVNLHGVILLFSLGLMHMDSLPKFTFASVDSIIFRLLALQNLLLHSRLIT